MNFFIFVDLDGVLADFDRGVLSVTGKYPWDQPPGRMWSILARTEGFYADLHWTPDGKKLWETVSPLKPVVLTGLPRGNWAEPQKRRWCSRELGESVPVITCMSREKAEYGAAHAPEGRVPVLIDDRESLKPSWEAMGGIFIHHRDTQKTLQELRHIGIL